MSNAPILITGATGFIGSALVSRLVADSARIRGAVRRTVSGTTSFEPVPVGSIDGNTQWADALAGVEVVVHLAARAHVMREPSGHPGDAFRRVNVDGTLNLASQAARAGVRRFLFVSSIGVNGSATFQRPFTADDRPEPHSLYAQSKHEGEQGLRRLAKETRLELVIIRPPLVYGPGAPGNFGALLRCVRRGLPLPLREVTGNRRSLVALDNLVDLIATCLDHPAAADQTFLVSDGEDVSTADLLRRLGRAAGKPARLLPVPVGLLKWGAKMMGKPEVWQSLCGSLQVDIRKTRQLLGWTPPIGMDEGLSRAAGEPRC